MLEVFTGPMWSGKTKAAVKRAAEAECFIAFKPNIDDRYIGISSHHGVRIFDPIMVKHPAIEIILAHTMPKHDVVIMDEVNFMDASVVDAIECLRDQHHVVVSGLDLTSDGEPFGRMRDIIDMADVVTYLRSKCNTCGKPASKTFRMREGNNVIDIGGADKYEPRCNSCWTKAMIGRIQM